MKVRTAQTPVVITKVHNTCPFRGTEMHAVHSNLTLREDQMKRIYMVGEKFGKLTVIQEADVPGYWLCHCECGNDTVVRGASLRSGNTKSCGCLRATNAGRPKPFDIANLIALDNFYAENADHLTAIRNYMKDHGVKVTADGMFSVRNQSYGPYGSGLHALAAAIQRTVAKPAP